MFSLNIMANISRLGLIQTSNLLVPLITFPYVMIKLGAESFGILVSSLAIVNLMNVVVQWGFELNAIREVANAKSCVVNSSKVYWHYLNAKLVLFILVVSIFYFFVLILEMDSKPVLLVKYTLILILANLLNPIWYYNAIGKMNLIYKHVSVIRYIQIPLTIILVKEPDDIIFAALIGPSTLLFLSIISTILLIKNSNLLNYSFSKYDSIKKITSSKTLFASAMMSSLTQNLPILILGRYTSYDMVAIYGVLDKIRQVYLILMKSINNVLYSHFSGTFVCNNKDSYKSFYKFSIKYLLLNMILLCSVALLLILAPERIFGEFKLVKDYFPLLIAILFTTSISSLLGIQWFVARQEGQLFLRGVIFGFLACLILCYQLITIYDVLGAILTLLIAEIVVLLVLIYYFIRNIKWSSLT